jgi:hypothetical protein
MAKKDWELPDNVVSPIWNDGYQRYDLSIEEIIQKIKDSGYNLEKIEDDDDDDTEFDPSDNYVLEIHSEKGIVVAKDIELTLTPVIYKNGTNITDSVDMKYFKWVRTSSDAVADAEWNLRHATGIKNLFITHEDVVRRAVFHCAFLTGTAETSFVSNMYAAYMSSINNKDGEKLG